MDKLLWYIYYISIKLSWKALCKSFINISIAVYDNSSRNFGLFLSFPSALSLHSQHTTPGRNLDDCDSFYRDYFPLPMCFEYIWLISFLNRQPTDKSKMKPQNLPSIICFLDNPLSVSALTRKRSKGLWVGCAFSYRCFKSTEEWSFWMETANFIPCSRQILHHCRLRRKAGGRHTEPLFFGDPRRWINKTVTTP